ncbi:ubiquitin carboxyl-terminal hydrolase isozyme L3 isoform X2 [Sceloporus undulatus]|uniref:ubiquitin carboxyl-terminal hydrolase isozyme L3 isoform X2 n=1 Tax=Sceloporus undulatus TaxID=8520 RepID=UPI001C4CADD2|nr:ubiquitin carboxyl-terminal hydrolase isozyme L3 isoform X2 [Sceloporus undulatus]
MCVLVFQVTNQFLKQLGIHPSWQFVDVYGMDQELLSMVPRPVCAILLLFPVTEKYETFRTEEENKIKAQGQEVKPSVYFMKQTISNACGTIGLIHAIANNRDKINFEADSSLKKFLDDSVPMSPEERAKYLETYEAIRVTHESSAHEGQTEGLRDVQQVLHSLTIHGFQEDHGRASSLSFMRSALWSHNQHMVRYGLPPPAKNSSHQNTILSVRGSPLLDLTLLAYL